MADRSLASVFVSVVPDTRETGRLLHRDLSKVDTERAGRDAGHRFGSGFSSGAKSIVGGVAGIVAAAGIGRVLKASVDGFRAHNVVVAQSNAVIRSTKGAANISAKAMSDYADALERQTKVDGDVILGGENMLATFTQVQNRAGKGNDIFNQSTKVLLDLAAATGTDAPKAAIQLGKALNDPIAGVSALSRVGVTFDAQQKKQIKSMQEAGNVAGAQKVVLAELNKEFGGSAKAQGDALGAQGRLTVAYHQAQDTIGKALLPVVNQLEDALATRLPAAATKAARGIMLADAGVRALVAAYQGGGVTSSGFVGGMERAGVQAQKLSVWLRQVDWHTFRVDAEKVGDAVQRIDFGKVGDQLKQIGSGEASHAAATFTVLGAGLQFVADHIGLVVKVLPLVLAGYAAYKAAEASANVAALASLPIRAAQVVSNILLARSIKSLAASNVQSAVATGTATAADVVNVAVTNAATASTLRGTFATIASATAQKAAAAATKVWAGGQLVLNAVMSANPIALVIIAVVALAAGIIYAYKHSETFRNVVNGAFSSVGKAAGVLWNGVLKPYFRFIVDAWLTVAGAIVNGAAKAFGWVPGIGGKLKSAAEAFNHFRDQVNSALAGVKSRSVTVKATTLIAGGVDRATAIGDSLHRAAGGGVYGAGTATSDSIPAMLSNGEHVWTARETAAVGGHGAMGRMRKAALAGQVAAYAKGGPVGFSVSPQLAGLDKFAAGLAAFNARVDTQARKLAAASGFSANLGGVVNYGKSVAGTPYSWGNMDCSGFVSRLVEVAHGQKPDHRLFSTGTLPSAYFANSGNVDRAFRVGWFTGNPGHVAATVNGVGMESRGGDGVVVNGYNGSSRGSNYGYFTNHAFLRLAGGGPVLPGDPPFDVLSRRGRHYQPGLLEELQGAAKFDSGGLLMPGVTMAVNGTGRPERVRTGVQEDALLAELRGLRRDLAQLPVAQVPIEYIARAVRNKNTRDPSGW